MVATENARGLARVAAQAAADKKARDLVLLDVSDQLVITDCFVIASAPNERQIEAIVDAVEEKMRKSGTKRVRREGEREGRWVLLDFVDVVVHVQHIDERAFYGLERLWKDCPRIEFEDVERTSSDSDEDESDVATGEVAGDSAGNEPEDEDEAESGHDDSEDVDLLDAWGLHDYSANGSSAQSNGTPRGTET